MISPLGVSQYSYPNTTLLCTSSAKIKCRKMKRFILFVIAAEMKTGENYKIYNIFKNIYIFERIESLHCDITTYIEVPFFFSSPLLKPM